MVSNPSPAEGAEAKPLRTFKQFLETSPPDVEVIVTERASGPHLTRGGGTFFTLLKPELDLHCETCDGTRTFKCITGYGTALKPGTIFQELDYECKNCKEGEKF